jgi:hypothetical protein
MFNNKNSSPSASPPTVTVSASPSNGGQAPPGRRSSSALGEVITAHELVIFRVLAGTAIVLAVLSQIPFVSGWLKNILDPRFHILVPIGIIYFSSKFGWKVAGEVGLLWLFGFTPVSLIFR